MELYIFLLICSFMGALTAFLAKQRMRNSVIWFVLGFMLGLIAILALYLLPSLKPATPKREKAELPQNGAAFNTNPSALAFDDENLGVKPPIKKRIPTNLAIKWYYITHTLERSGPHNLNELRKIFIEENIDANTHVWCDELPAWTPLQEFGNASTVYDRELL